ncbi:MAG: galactokinase [Candidatus Marinimicrobia bacterium]|nr:galactokinase [Candidatus Neomarinimicrobiota bacterium]
MQNRINAIKLLNAPKIKELLYKLYGKDNRVIQKQIRRYGKIIKQYQNYFFSTPVHLFSAPGRTEIGGNHTDHNAGRVLAATINLDSIAAVTETRNNTVTINSEGYTDPFKVVLDDLEPKKEEEGTTTALIRGIAARFKELGYNIGGFNACISSNVMVGSGLSSSASIEVLIGTIINHLYNEGKISKKEIALIGQYAENNYFNKPCGLMDQLTIAVGGIVSIDFRDSKNPIVTKVDFDINAQDYSLIVVDTGGNHADLTEDYASIPGEMKSVARELGGEVCRDITHKDLIEKVRQLRPKVGDRAILRALHFLEDNQRVLDQVEALEKGNFDTFLDLVNESGSSSCKWLQNCFTIKNPSEQGINLALALAENYLKNSERKGACRVHGGGFAGTIQVFIPDEILDGYLKMIKDIFGEKSVEILSIRPVGSIHLNAEL